jgi:predicted dinucleotide-binding enzyme
MKIGIIGAGQVAIAFARYALDAGHEVVLSNSGDMDRLARACKPSRAWRPEPSWSRPSTRS